MQNPHQVAIVTGSSRGIGKAIAEQMSRDGFSVVINYARNQSAADALVKQITTSGGEAIAVQGNIAIHNDRVRLVDAAYEAWGRLDVLVNNAGISSLGRNDLLDATEESWNAVFETNLKGPFFLSQYAAKQMKEQIQAQTIPSGKIINISSISAFTASTNRADYCIAKAGLTMMTALFADRLAQASINVYEIAPGVIKTDMTDGVKQLYDQRIADGLTPIRRWGQPEDVALAVSAITDGKFPFSTGAVFPVDGGFHLRRL